jgi:hypothetical protein
MGGFPMASLKSEIAQATPFSSVEEEALLNLMRTSDCLQRAFQQKIRGFGLTSTQYNVLRILRGAQPDGLTCAAIGARMIAIEPDITRLAGAAEAPQIDSPTPRPARSPRGLDADFRCGPGFAARYGSCDSAHPRGTAGAYQRRGTDGVNSAAGVGARVLRRHTPAGIILRLRGSDENLRKERAQAKLRGDNLLSHRLLIQFRLDDFVVQAIKCQFQPV